MFRKSKYTGSADYTRNFEEAREIGNAIEEAIKILIKDFIEFNKLEHPEEEEVRILGGALCETVQKWTKPESFALRDVVRYHKYKLNDEN
jgi:hypothetical protein